MLRKFLEKRAPLLQWSAWFTFGNALLFFLINFRSILWVIPGQHETFSLTNAILSWIFLILASAGHFFLLAAIPGLLLLAPFIIFIPNRKVIFTAAVLSCTAAAVLLIIDSYVFSQYRFHLNGLILTMTLSEGGNQIIVFSLLEKVILTFIIAVTLLVEIWLCQNIAKHLDKLHRSGIEIRWIFILLGCLAFSQLMLMFSAIQPSFRPIAAQTQAFPLYNNFLAKLIPTKHSLRSLEALGQMQFNHPDYINHPLNYPLHPLRCNEQKNPLNLLIIVIDTWRFDMLTPEVMPHVSRFSNKAWQFTHHLSGGNGTEPGLFSLFYGITANYWTAMEKQERGPLLIDTLLQHHYQPGIFGSAPLYMPSFSKTVFKAIPNLLVTTPGENVQERDTIITQRFKQFLADIAGSRQPFFGFLFYDAAHSFCDKTSINEVFRPAVKECNHFNLTKQADAVSYKNRYKNALHFIDDQINLVLNDLAQRHLLDNTVVLITGDHGEEFNDNQQGFWGHASNYTRYQLQTPLVVYWPKKAPQHFSHFTSHYDIAPFLLSRLCHCTNPPDDYSMGKDLFLPFKNDYFIARGYIDFGVVEKDRITRVFSTGNYEVSDLNARNLPEAQIHPSIMQRVLMDSQRFFQGK